jgi:hypothetical protein
MDYVLDLLYAVKDYVEKNEQRLGDARSDGLSLEDRIRQGRMPMVYGDVLAAIGRMTAHEDPAAG